VKDMNYLSSLKDIANDTQIYIVGGTIRDYLLNREIKDIDLLVMSDLERIVNKFSQLIKRKKIVLDKKRNIYRIVTEDNKFIDFTNPVGQDLYQDLGCRDFTINSMALALDNLSYKNDNIFIKKENIIDPFKGVKDLENKRIRMVSSNFIDEDPIRILRAFRFSNNLNFEIAEDTYQLIAENKKILSNISGERIKDEIFKMFSKYLKPEKFKLLLKSNLVKVIFSIDFKNNIDVHNKLLKQISFVKKEEYLSKIEMDNYIFNLILFFMRPVYHGFISIEVLKKYLLSYTFNKKAVNVIGDYLYSLNYLLKNYNILTNNDILIYEELFFKETEVETLKYLLLSFFYTEHESQQQEIILETLDKLKIIKERLSYQFIDGNDVKNIMNIKEGELIGDILAELKKKQALGFFDNRKDVIKYLQKYAKRYNNDQ